MWFVYLDTGIAVDAPADASEDEVREQALNELAGLIEQEQAGHQVLEFVFENDL